MAYQKRSTEELKAFGMKFSEAERKAYRKGKKMGFLNGVHAPRKTKKK